MYHLFGPMKDILSGKDYVSEDETKTEMLKCLKERSTDFNRADTCSNTKVEHCY